MKQNAYHDVETVLIIFFQLGPLWSWVMTIEFYVLISCLKVTGNLHLDAFVGGYNNL